MRTLAMTLFIIFDVESITFGLYASTIWINV